MIYQVAYGMAAFPCFIGADMYVALRIRTFNLLWQLHFKILARQRLRGREKQGVEERVRLVQYDAISLWCLLFIALGSSEPADSVDQKFIDSA